MKSRLSALLTAGALMLAAVNATHGEVNVKTYGAQGNNSNDDRAAIQNAINAALEGESVFFPVGVYRISSGLSTTKALHFRGEGTGASGVETPEKGGAVLLATANNFTMLHLGEADGGTGNGAAIGPKIENLVFSGRLSPTAKTVKGLKIRKMPRWTIINCTFRNCSNGLETDADRTTWGGNSLNGENAWGAVLHCFFRDNTRGIYTPHSGSPQLILGGEFTNNTTGIDIVGGAQCKIMSAKFDGGTTSIKTTASGTLIFGCGFEDATSRFILVDDTAPHSDSGKGARVRSNNFGRASAAKLVENLSASPVLVDDNYVSGSSLGISGPTYAASLVEQTAASTPGANTIVMYAKDVGGVSRLCYKDDAGIEHILQ